MIPVRATDLELVSLGDRLEQEGGAACVLGPGGEILFVNGAWKRLAREGLAPRAAAATGRAYAELAGAVHARLVARLCERARSGDAFEIAAPEAAAELPRSRAIRFEPVALGGLPCALVIHRG